MKNIFTISILFTTTIIFAQGKFFGGNGGGSGSAEIFNQVLPIELNYFKANKLDNYILLNWETASETNNKGFEIQRSMDGAHFSKIAFVDGNGNAQEKNNYSYLDKNATESNIYYYRLRQMDWDGKTSMSPVEVVYLYENKTTARLSPNPVDKEANIYLNNNIDETAYLKIFDLSGKLIDSKKMELWEGANTISLSTSDWKSGTYILSLETTRHRHLFRMVKL